MLDLRSPIICHFKIASRGLKSCSNHAKLANVNTSINSFIIVNQLEDKFESGNAQMSTLFVS